MGENDALMMMGEEDALMMGEEDALNRVKRML